MNHIYVQYHHTLALRKLWTDLEPDEAPVVLVVGSETETGQVVLRKLITSGYPCVELKSASGEQSLGQQSREGSTIVTAVAQTTNFPGTRGNVMQGLMLKRKRVS